MSIAVLWLRCYRNVRWGNERLVGPTGPEGTDFGWADLRR